MTPADLNFGSPWWLWGLAAIPVFIGLFLRAERRSAKRLATLLPEPRLRAQLTGTASASRRRWRYTFLLAGLAGLLVAMAQPRWGYEARETHRRGLDVIIVMDVSRSMLAPDVAPSRLARAKLNLHDLVLELNGDRLGLVAFAGSAFLQAPLTTDYDAVLRAVDELDTDLIPMGGTNIGAGIDLALEAFGKAEAGNRAILLLSDGEPTADSDQADGVKAAARAAEDGVKVFTLGFGTPAGATIPLTGENAGQFVRDTEGKLVRTRLNEAGLQEIAHAGGGFYVRFQNDGSGLRTIIEHGLSQLKTGDIDALISRRPVERFQWPLGVALAALGLGMLLGERRQTRAPAAVAGDAARSRVATAAALASAAVCALGAIGDRARAADSPQLPPAGALDLYRGGHYEQAYGAFEDLAKQHPGVPNLEFDAGASAYMAKQYDEAVDAFGKALTADDPALQARSQYNFGNALFRRGEHQTEPARKISDWRDAIEHYNTVLNALKMQPPHTEDALARNAIYNRDVVQQRLNDALKKPAQPQPQKQSGAKNRPNGAPQQKSNPDDQQTGQDQQPSPGGGAAGEQAVGNRPHSQSGDRPDPGSVPNQDKPRQRGDFQAQPGDRPGQAPPEQKQVPGQDSAAGHGGGMTPDQARSLLQSLKDEDTTVNLNDDPDDPTRRDDPVLKDW
jgi:Ca-activated chloride channel family protein